MLGAFENYWFYGNAATGGTGAGGRLTPIGAMQAAMKRWAAATPQASRGVHLATVGVLLGSYSGWDVPCQRQSAGPFTTAFGTRPYEAADFLADGVFDLAFPGYRAAGLYHDDRFELSPTPYGDIVDVLLSDADAALLARYDTLVVAHALPTERAIVADRLGRFVRGGGRLVLTWDSLADLGPSGLLLRVGQSAGASEWMRMP